MMTYPIIHQGREVGRACLQEQGLYWLLSCRCAVDSHQVERLYSGTRRLGVLERDGDGLRCRRHLSRASVPELPPKSGCLTLRPYELWHGKLAEVELWGLRDGGKVLFPYDGAKPCPCEPLLCFFEIADGFWKLQLEKFE